MFCINMLKVPFYLGSHPTYRNKGIFEDFDRLVEFVSEISGETLEEKMEYWNYVEELREDICHKLDSTKFGRKLAGRISIDYPIAIIIGEEEFPTEEEINEKYQQVKEKEKVDRETEIIYRKWKKRKKLENHVNKLCMASGRVKTKAVQEKKKEVLEQLENEVTVEEIEAPSPIITMAGIQYADRLKEDGMKKSEILKILEDRKLEIEY